MLAAVCDAVPCRTRDSATDAARAGRGRRQDHAGAQRAQRRPISAAIDQDVIALAKSRPTILTVGQIAPFRARMRCHAVCSCSPKTRRAGDYLGDLPAGRPISSSTRPAARAASLPRGHSDRVHFVGVARNVLEIIEASYLLRGPDRPGRNVRHRRCSSAPASVCPSLRVARGGLTELVEHATGYVCETPRRDGAADPDCAITWPMGRRASREREQSVRDGGPRQRLHAPEFERRWWSDVSAQVCAGLDTIEKFHTR